MRDLLLVLLDWLLLIRFADSLELKLKLFMYKSTEILLVYQNKIIVLQGWSHLEFLNLIKAKLALGVRTLALKAVALSNFLV